MNCRKDLEPMSNKRKRRLSPTQAKRLRTLRERKSREQIIEDARKAGKQSGGHFSSESSKLANKKRWEAYRAAKEKENG